MIGQFRRYDHVERIGHPEVGEIDLGTVLVFPKLDGTNASAWRDAEGVVQCGSRNRVLSADADNAGFHAWVNGDSDAAIALRVLLLGSPDIVVYGEWLVPHAIKDYAEDAWRRFWIFDVYSHTRERYLSYDEYGESFVNMGLDVVRPLCVMECPSRNQLNDVLQQNTFLMKDGTGVGEGIVLKNYLWKNKFGRQPWAKVITNEFKVKHGQAHGVPIIKGEKQIEREVVDALATEAFIRKEWLKVVHLVYEDRDPVTDWSELEETAQRAFVLQNRHKLIPRFLGTLFYVFVQEEIHTILKKWKCPVLDFGKLNKLLTLRAKAVMTEVF